MFYVITIMSVGVLAPIIDRCFSYQTGATLRIILSIISEKTATSLVQNYDVNPCSMDSNAVLFRYFSLLTSFVIMLVFFITFSWELLEQMKYRTFHTRHCLKSIQRSEGKLDSPVPRRDGLGSRSPTLCHPLIASTRYATLRRKGEGTVAQQCARL